MLMKTARLYHCVRCQCQTVICSHCDRGNVYCGLACSQQTRVENHRIANRLYQNSRKGRHNHAERQRRYRSHQKIKVTDQGSTDLPINDLLPKKLNEHGPQQAGSIHCDFCSETVSPFLRQSYLHQT
jgi:hypothetical protein